MSKKFRGTGVALVTPFRKDGSVDFKGLGKLIEHTISGGVDFLVVLGTTGEPPTLTTDEKNAVLAYSIEVIDKRVPIVYGCGGNNTQEILDVELRKDVMKEIDAILSVSPYYNKPTQKGIYAHFKAVADSSPVPVILYNVPSRTGGGGMTVETIAELSSHPNIIGIKEATGDIILCQKIIHACPADFLLICGDDAVNYPFIAVGGGSIISVIGNAYPKETSEVVKLALGLKCKLAKEAHYKLHTMTELMFEEGNPAGVKAALSQLGICDDFVRLPLVKASKNLHTKIKAEAVKLNS